MLLIGLQRTPLGKIPSLSVFRATSSRVTAFETHTKPIMPVFAAQGILENLHLSHRHFSSLSYGPNPPSIVALYMIIKATQLTGALSPYSVMGLPPCDWIVHYPMETGQRFPIGPEQERGDHHTTHIVFATVDWFSGRTYPLYHAGRYNIRLWMGTIQTGEAVKQMT